MTRRSKAALDDVFGDVLPDSSRDERDGDQSMAGGGAAEGLGFRSGVDRRREEDLLSDVPPHHG